MLVTVCVCVCVPVFSFAGLVNCAVLSASKARFTLTHTSFTCVAQWGAGPADCVGLFVLVVCGLHVTRACPAAATFSHSKLSDLLGGAVLWLTRLGRPDLAADDGFFFKHSPCLALHTNCCVACFPSWVRNRCSTAPSWDGSVSLLAVAQFDTPRCCVQAC